MLVLVGEQSAVVLNILDPIPISIIVTLVPNTIIISIFLPRVGCQKAVVLLAMFVIVHAGQRLVWVAIDVRVRPTYVPVPCPAHVTLAGHCTVVFKETVSVNMARAVGWAVAGPHREAALCLIAQETQSAGPTFERSHSVGTDGVWVTATVVTIIAFIDVTADLFAGPGIVDAHTRHLGALIPSRTGLTVEARHSVDAAGAREAGFSMSTLIDVRAVGAVALQARGTGSTAVAWVLIHFHAVHTLEAGVGAAVRTLLMEAAHLTFHDGVSDQGHLLHLVSDIIPQVHQDLVKEGELGDQRLGLFP